MKDKAFLDEKLSPEEVEQINGLFACGSDRIDLLCEVCRLDKAVDFRFSDLHGVDFTDADLRGFDFTGADLRGAYGVNFTIDASTIFDQADVDNSVFAYTSKRDKFFRENPKWEKEYRRIKDSDWLAVGGWIGDRLLANEDRNAISRVALRVFEQTKDSSVKSSILYYSRYDFISSQDYRDFLVHQLVENIGGSSISIASTALQLLVSLYPKDLVVFELCRKLLYHKREGVRSNALWGILASGRFDAVKQEVADLVAGEQSREVRQRYTLILTKRHSRIAAELFAEWDFKDALVDEVVERMALAWQSRDRGGETSLSIIEERKREENWQKEDRRRREALIVDIAKELARAGLPLRFV